MKHKELMILANLRQNSRETLTALSQKTRVPISTIFDKMKLMEQGIIQKHTTIVDFGKLGFATRANMTLRVDKSERDRIKDFLDKHQSINSIYKINNGYDFLIEAVFRNLRDLEDFQEMIDLKFKIKERQVYYIIEDIKREAFMSDPGMVDMLVTH